MRWARYVERVGKMKGGCSVVGDKPEGRKPTSRPRRGRVGGTRMHLKVVFLLRLNSSSVL